MKWSHTLKNQISHTNQVKDDLAILKSNYHLIKLVWGHRELSPSDKNGLSGNSLAVQWLGLCTFTAEDLSSVSGCRTRILQAEWHSQKKKKESAAPRPSPFVSSPGLRSWISAASHHHSHVVDFHLDEISRKGNFLYTYVNLNSLKIKTRPRRQCSFKEKKGESMFLCGSEACFYIFKAIIHQTISRNHDEYSEEIKPNDLTKKGQTVNMVEVCIWVKYIHLWNTKMYQVKKSKPLASKPFRQQLIAKQSNVHNRNYVP